MIHGEPFRRYAEKTQDHHDYLPRRMTLVPKPSPSKILKLQVAEFCIVQPRTMNCSRK